MSEDLNDGYRMDKSLQYEKSRDLLNIPLSERDFGGDLPMKQKLKRNLQQLERFHGSNDNVSEPGEQQDAINFKFTVSQTQETQTERAGEVDDEAQTEIDIEFMAVLLKQLSQMKTLERELFAANARLFQLKNIKKADKGVECKIATRAPLTQQNNTISLEIVAQVAQNNDLLDQNSSFFKSDKSVSSRSVAGSESIAGSESVSKSSNCSKVNRSKESFGVMVQR